MPCPLTFHMSARLLTPAWFQAPFSLPRSVSQPDPFQMWLDFKERFHLRVRGLFRAAAVSVATVQRHVQMWEGGLMGKVPATIWGLLMWLHAYTWMVVWGMMSSLKDEEHYPLAWSWLHLCALFSMSQLLEINWIQFCYTVFVALLMVIIAWWNTSMKEIHSKEISLN